VSIKKFFLERIFNIFLFAFKDFGCGLTIILYSSFNFEITSIQGKTLDKVSPGKYI